MPRRSTYLAITGHGDKVTDVEVLNGSKADAILTVKIGDVSDPAGTVHIVLKMDHVAKEAEVVYMRILPDPRLIVNATRKATPSSEAYNFVQEKLGDVSIDEDFAGPGSTFEFAQYDAPELIRILARTTQLLPAPPRATSRNSHHHPVRHHSRPRAKSPGCAVICCLVFSVICLSLLAALATGLVF